MDYNYISNLSIEMINQGFEPINFKEINNIDHLLMLGKQKGANFYSINIYNTNGVNSEMFYKMKAFSSEYYKALNKKYNFRNVIVYNIVVSYTNNDWISKFINSSEEYYDQQVYEINYLVNLELCKVIKPSVKVTDILNIYNELNKNFGKKSYDEDKINNYKIKKNIISTKVTKPFITYVIGAINIVMFIIMTLDGDSTNPQTLLKYGAMNYNYFMDGEYYRVITASFLHIGITHLIFNTLSLSIFGSRVEKHYGRFPFLIIYLFSSICGNFFNALFFEGVLAGASAGIFGLIGASLAITQLTRKSLQGLSAYSILLLIGTNLVIGFITPNIGNIAHIAGLISGYIISFLILKLDPNITKL